MNRKWAITSVAIVLAVAAHFVGCVGYYAYWVGGYQVAVHLRRAGSSPVVGVVTLPMVPEHFQYAKDALGAAPDASPRYFEVLEGMIGRRPVPVENDALPIAVNVRRWGKDETFPWRERVHDFRETLLAIGVYFADGSRNCFITNIPGPDEPPDIVVEVSAAGGEPSDAAESR